MTRHPGPSLAELLRLAESACRIGGAIARDMFGRSIDVHYKHDNSEVTDIDVAAERAVIDHIRAQRPHDLFIGEEAVERDTLPQHADPDAQRFHWIIDPIDGTRNFVRGVPLFACTVAVARHGTPVCGAIYEPLADRMTVAVSGGGARMNGAALTIESENGKRLPGRKLVVAVPSARFPAGQHLVKRVIDRHVVRSFGCATLHLAGVACGWFDAAILNNSKLWDIAAGWLIVQEAGATITDLEGRPVFPRDLSKYQGEEMPCLAAPSAIHAELCGLNSS